MANRRKQIEAIQTKAATLAEELEALLDELREAYDNMPESLKDAPNGVTAGNRIDMLENWLDNITEVSEEVIE